MREGRTVPSVMRGERTARLLWTLGLAIAWPITAVVAFHLAWGPMPTGDFLGGALGVLGYGLLLTVPGALAIAAAEDSARWRRIIGATIATTSALTVIGYGVLVEDTIGCGRQGTPAEVAVSMLLPAVTVGIGAGLTAWQGGRLIVTYRSLGIPLALILGWTMLALSLGAALFRSLSVSCFGY